jgi:hypothetical protein
MVVLVGLITLLAAFAFLVSHNAVRKTAPKTVTYGPKAIPSGGKTLIFQKGQGPAHTSSFVAPQKWDLYWNFICYGEYGKDGFRVSITGPGAANVQPIVASGISGYGDKPVTESGSFALSIKSDPSCHWEVTAKTN